MTEKKAQENKTPNEKTVVNIQPVADNTDAEKSDAEKTASETAEIGGRKGPEPTRYGDWEKNGRCIDF